MRHKVNKIHFIGIGGVGMSGIAEILLNQGYEVSGSDQKENNFTGRLRNLGAKIFIGHAAENLDETDVVVISSAVRPDNPEVVAARYRQVPVIPRAEMLAELMRMKRGVAVGGSHGKTTITSMITQVLAAAGMDPTAIIGGKLALIDSNAKLGTGEWLVAEADESDGSFLFLTPMVVVVSNIDREHMDHYKTMENLENTFVKFMDRVPFYGLVVACADNPVVRSLIPRVKRRVVTYGLAGDCDVRAVEVHCAGRSCEFVAVWEGKRLGEVTLGVPGMHNALNALAALAVAFELEVPFGKAVEGLRAFSGAGRRFEIKGEKNGVTVIDDYGHHPTEIRATLKAARDFMKTEDRDPDARLIVVFQPHRYTRTRDLWQDFVESFDDAGMLFLTGIYEASEDPIPGITGKTLCDEVARRRAEAGKETGYEDNFELIPALVAATARPGDVVVTLGAGSVTRLGPEILAALEKNK